MLHNRLVDLTADNRLHHLSPTDIAKVPTNEVSNGTKTKTSHLRVTRWCRTLPSRGSVRFNIHVHATYAYMVASLVLFNWRLTPCATELAALPTTTLLHTWTRLPAFLFHQSRQLGTSITRVRLPLFDGRRARFAPCVVLLRVLRPYSLANACTHAVRHRTPKLLRTGVVIVIA